MGEGNFQDYGMRMYNPRIGRFFNVDPLTKDYAELTPYQFASNMPISAIDLDGLEAKLSIAGSGGASTHYSSSDIISFDLRASSYTKKGFKKESVHNGQMIRSAFVAATKRDGSILSIISFAHSGANGLYLDNNEGFYTADYGVLSTTSNLSNLDEVIGDVKGGLIKFEKNACWIFASCNAGNPDDPVRPTIDEVNLAQYVAVNLNITTIGARGYVSPEIKNGKETGVLISDNMAGSSAVVNPGFTMYKPIQVSNVPELLKAESTAVPNQNEFHTEILEIDLGNKIDPLQYLPKK